MNARRGTGRAPARGMAALTVVMVLFFIMALVAAYANRNLIFEQRVAANSYRAERALVAIDSGAEWAITLLNSGRIDMACRPSSSAGDLPLRERLVTRGVDGRYDPITVNNSDPLFASCVNRGAALTCVCPTAADPDPVPHAVKNWPLNGGGTAFRVNLFKVPVPQPQPQGGVVMVVQGCGSPGTGNTSCGSDAAVPEVDGSGSARVYLGLVQALPQVPVSTLTVGQDADASAVVLKVGNADGATGLTVHAGRNITPGGGSVLAGPAGTPGDGRLDNDSTLFNLRPTVANRFTAADTFFRATFGMDAPTYRRQPAVARIACATGCTGTDLQAGLARYPGMTLWFDGDLRVDSAPASGTLGSATHPVMVIATGQLSVEVAVDITGFLYARDMRWTGAAGTAVLRGAAMVVNDFTADVPATLVYDADALKTIQLYYGSFVRVPGGWSRV
jgi:hypothetical protein